MLLLGSCRYITLLKRVTARPYCLGSCSITEYTNSTRCRTICLHKPCFQNENASKIGKLIRNPCVNTRNRYILSIKAYLYSQIHCEGLTSTFIRTKTYINCNHFRCSVLTSEYSGTQLQMKDVLGLDFLSLRLSTF